MKKPKNYRDIFAFFVISSLLMVLAYLSIPRFQVPDSAPPVIIKSSSSIIEYEEIKTPIFTQQMNSEAVNIIEQSISESIKTTEAALQAAPCQHCIASKNFREKLSKPLPKPPVYKEPQLAKGYPRIAIIIDDVGVDKKRSREIIEIVGPFTMAFLPYAKNIDDLLQRSKNNGHEIMIHMPMQALDSDQNLGSIALKTGMSETQINAELDKAFVAFDGYVGMNNHMGSQLTQDVEAMSIVMQRLKKEGLYFIDSMTIGNSKAWDIARTYGVPTAKRDVFLDHVNALDAVKAALRDLEEIANRKGYAIAIGHPREATIEALSAWVPDAKARGFKFVTASALLAKPEEKILKEFNPVLIAPVQLQSLPHE